MRAFAEAWPEPEILQQLIAKLPQGHQTRRLDRIKDRLTREWYLKAAIENGLIPCWHFDRGSLQGHGRL